jgi:hypothetical protein
VQLFFTDQRTVWKVGQVAGLSQAELSALFARRLVPSSTPVLLDEAMRPVEPVSSWFPVAGAGTQGRQDDAVVRVLRPDAAALPPGP